MKKKVWIIVGGAVLLLALAGVYFMYSFLKPNTVAYTYQEVLVRKGDIALSFSTDALVQGEIVSISAPVSEKVTEMKVSVGSEIAKGQHVFSIDSTKLVYQYNSAMATYSKAIYERNQIDKVLKPDAYRAAQQVVNSTYAQVQIAKFSREQARVVSPVSGIVSEVAVHAGEYPAQNQGAIIKIVKKGTLYIATVLDESEVGKITKNTPVTIMLDALGKKMQGKITAISPVAIKDSAGYSVFPVTIAVSDATSLLRVGFEGTVQFVTKTVTDVIQVPVNAVFLEGGKTYVMKKSESGAVKTEVVSSFTDGKVVEIIEGLSVGDIVLIKK